MRDPDRSELHGERYSRTLALNDGNARARRTCAGAVARWWRFDVRFPMRDGYGYFRWPMI